MTHFHQISAIPLVCALWAACGAPQSEEAVRPPSEPKPIGITFKLSTEGPPTSMLVDAIGEEEQPGWLRLFRNGVPMFLNRPCSSVPVCPSATLVGGCQAPSPLVWSAATTNEIAFNWDGGGWGEQQDASGTCATPKAFDLSGLWEVEFCVRGSGEPLACIRKPFDPKLDTLVEHKIASSPLPSCEGKPWGSYGGRVEDEPIMSALGQFYNLRGEPVTSMHLDEVGPNRHADVRINFSLENVVVHSLTPRQEDGKWLFDIDWACQLVGGKHGRTPQ
jgi:hypothetical protein